MSKELIEAIATGNITTYIKTLRQGGIDVPSLLALFAERPPEERVNLVTFLARYGGPVFDVRPDALASLVRLCSDPDHDVYAEAASIVAHEVPDDLVRDHAADLMRVIEAHPEDDTSAWLAAKLGSARARRLVVEDKVAPRMDPIERDLVLGKLGDAEAEQNSLARYHQAMDPEGDLDDTPMWTWHMGRMGTPAAVLALARDLRHPGVYHWVHGTNRTVRGDVVAGLAAAFPRETVLHEERTSNDDYVRVEKWAERKFGMTWPAPRPKYLHPAPAPRYK